MQKTLVFAVIFISLGFFVSAQENQGNNYLDEVTRLRKAATRQIELSADTCDQYPDSSRFNFWFVLTRLDGNKTEIKVISESTKAPVNFRIYPHKPLDVNWALMAAKNEQAILIIPASIGCPESSIAESAHLPLVPSYLPDHFAGFWSKKIQVLQPVWCQLSSRSRRL